MSIDNVKDFWQSLTRLEWGAVVTALTAGTAALWRWLIGRKKAAADLEASLDDSRISTLGKSWTLQGQVFDELKRQIAVLTSDMVALRKEHRHCEEQTDKLARQNRQQAEQIMALQQEVASLRRRLVGGDG